jgi:nitrogen regulatory protein PII
MQQIKRVEIIISTLELESVLRMLERSEVSGYSVIKRVTGKGSRGIQDGEGLSDAFMNCMVLVGCTEEEFSQFKEPLRELLSETGGVCFVSDAQSVLH